MNAEATLLKESFVKAASNGDVFIESFYNNLFAIAPEARSLFPTDMSAQRKKLLLSFLTIIEAVADEDQLRSYLRLLGQKHAEEYGIQAAHYEIFEEVIMKTLADALAEDWTPELEALWLQTIQFIAAEMNSAES